MAGNYSNGRTTQTVQDFINRYTTEEPVGNTETLDYYNPFELVLAELAAESTNGYFRTVSQSGSPTAMPSATITGNHGNIYEIDYPADCQNDGVEFLTVSWGATPSVVGASLTVEAEEEDWNMQSADTVYWRQGNRKVRAYVPSAYSSSTPKYSLDYKRLPAYPTTSSDILDVAAEDAETAYQNWKNRIVR